MLDKIKNNQQTDRSMKCLILATFLLFALPAFGQTTSPYKIITDTNGQVHLVFPSQEDLATHQPWRAQTSQDIAKVCWDFGIRITPEAVDQLFGLLNAALYAFIGGRILRKGVPDKWQTGWFKTVLQHVALEINPKADNAVPSAPTPTVTTKPNP
jgi:hypothetical protein